jgi:hypothetical protein
LIRNYHIALILALFATTLNAQTGNIEFIENKGQWDQKIKFNPMFLQELFLSVLPDLQFFSTTKAI